MQNMPLSYAEQQFIYRWFASFLCQEINEKQLNALQGGEFEPLFALLADYGFDKEIANFQAEITACTTQPFAQLELAADFAQLFLLDGKLCALPYASAYLTGKTLDSHLAQMDSLLDQLQLQRNPNSKEPSDHIGVYFQLIDQYLNQAQSPKSALFLLQQWLYEWVNKAQTIPTHSRFYQTLLRLFERFVQWEMLADKDRLTK